MKIDPKDYGEKNLKRRGVVGRGWQRKESVFIKRLQGVL